MPRGGKRLRTEDGKLNQIGLRVHQRRDFLDLTQDELCALVAGHTGGIWAPAWQDMSRIENGGRIVSDLELLALAHVLECDPAWLLTAPDEPPTADAAS